jgi:putative hemolysin
MSIIILLISMLINGVFAMVEIALVSSRKTRLEQRADRGESGAAAALELLKQPNRFLSTVQIGITLVGIFSGAFGASQLSPPLAEILARIDFLEPYAEEIAFTFLVLIITYFSIVIGELVPKRVAINNPEAVSSALAIPMRFLSILVKPIVSLLSASSEFGARLLGIKPGNEPAITEEEIKVLIEQGHQVGVFKEAEREMFSGVFRMGGRKVSALMTPRIKMTWININNPIHDIWNYILKTSHARVPVADENLDNLLGYIQVRDLLGASPDDPEFDLKNYVKEPLYLPENMSAIEALDNFQIGGVHLAIVVDEFGGIKGMVTDYDILKTIVGDIPEDIGDTDQLAYQREDSSWLFDGLIVIDQLQDILNISEMPGEKKGVYQTLSGFVMSQLGQIPQTGSKFEYQGFEFEVVDMDGRRVDRVLVSRKEDS